jgi:ADP-ribose pyrophosphatase YjhB (NUDIX family)
MSHEEYVKYPTGKIKKGKWCDNCGRYNHRYSSSDVIVLDQTKKNILLIKRAKEPMAGCWALPGGYVDWDETIEETAIREVKEETGVTITNVTQFRVSSSPTRELDDRQNISHILIGVAHSKTVEIDPQEVINAQWCNLNDIPINMAFDHKKVIENFKNSNINIFKKEN